MIDKMKRNKADLYYACVLEHNLDGWGPVEKVYQVSEPCAAKIDHCSAGNRYAEPFGCNP